MDESRAVPAVHEGARWGCRCHCCCCCCCGGGGGGGTVDRERAAAKISMLKSLRSRARPERLPLYQPPTTFAVTYRPPPPPQMGAADGYLFYSCQGARAADLSHLPAWLLKVRAACASLHAATAAHGCHCDPAIAGRANASPVVFAGAVPGPAPLLAPSAARLSPSSSF